MRYFDLDLIYDPVTFRLVVAHPMEFQGPVMRFNFWRNVPIFLNHINNLTIYTNTVFGVNMNPRLWLVAHDVNDAFDHFEAEEDIVEDVLRSGIFHVLRLVF